MKFLLAGSSVVFILAATPVAVAAMSKEQAIAVCKAQFGGQGAQKRRVQTGMTVQMCVKRKMKAGKS